MGEFRVYYFELMSNTRIEVCKQHSAFVKA